MIALLLLACIPASPPSGADSAADRDADGDGYRADSDCDDHDPAVHPGVEEVCANGQDDDCNGAVDASEEGCAWVGDWDVGSADVSIPMADGGQGASPSEWATLGSVVAVPYGLRGLEFHDLAGRVDTPKGTSDDLEGLDGVGLIRPLGGSDADALVVAQDPSLNAVLSFGRLTDALAFVPSATLHFQYGDSTCDLFGRDATALGTQGDAGASRVAVSCLSTGWPSPEAPPSYVYVFPAGLTGEFGLDDATLTISGSFWELGADVRARDVDDDGVDDLLIGESDWMPSTEPHDDFGSSNFGRVYLFDGTTTGTVAEDDADGLIDGVRPGVLGRNVAPVDDVDGDGYPEVAVADGHGVYLFRGPLRGEVTVDDAWGTWEPSAENAATLPGYALEPAGDVDGDGRPELLVGATWARDAGTFVVYDLGAGSHALEEGSAHISGRTGICLAPGVDLDDDGLSDVVLGRTGPLMDTVSVFFGRAR